MRPLPLKWRVSLLVTVAIVVAISIVLFVAWSETKETLLHQASQTLLSMDRGITSVVTSSQPRPNVAKEVRAIVGASDSKHSSFYRIWLDGQETLCSDGTVATDPKVLQAPWKSSAPVVGQRVFADVVLPGGEFRLMWHKVPSPQGVANIVVGLSTRDIYGELRELMATLTLIGGTLIGVVIVLIVLLVTWGLRPITTVAQKLRCIKAGNVGSFQLDALDVPAEVRPFVESVSDLLGRLNSAMHRQKGFIADASHELRTPIALAKSTVQLALNQDRQAHEYKQALSNTLDDLRRMEQLTEDLLVLARLEEMQEIPDPSEVDLSILLEHLMEQFSPRAAESGTEIVGQLNPATVRGNENQLRRLFSNLLDNAMKHGPKGQPIQISCSWGDDHYVTVRIHDNGGQIPPDVLPRLFDRFYRADASRAHSTGGAGLGLAIAHEIALRHNGEIVITSDRQSGTTLTVRLPIS